MRLASIPADFARGIAPCRTCPRDRRLGPSRVMAYRTRREAAGTGLLQTAPVTEQGLLAAVAASRSWYDDIFDLHRIAVGSDGALWWAEGAAPRWHSAVKTLVPTIDHSDALLRMERHPHGTIADSFGLLDLAAQGFDLLFAATWLRHPRFAVLARHDGDDLTGGAILHDARNRGLSGSTRAWRDESRGRRSRSHPSERLEPIR